MDLLEIIAQLEGQARRLEPGREVRSKWNEEVMEYCAQFIDELPIRKAFNEGENTGQGIEDCPIEEDGKDMTSLIQVIEKSVDEPALNPASGGHLAYIPGGGIFPTALGDYLADISNNYAGIFFGGPGAVRLENQLIRWMCKVVGYPSTALGNLTSGGSIANLIAVATARDKKGISPEHIAKSVIYLTEQAHHSVQKAIRIAGLGTCILRYIPLDNGFRMDADALQRQLLEDKDDGLNPFMIVASAGTTDTGAIDPMDRIADLSEEYGCWFHVDAAYGGFFILVDEIEPQFKGMERSDSITIDPHKGLFLSYGTGAILIKDVDALRKTHYYKANYMQDVIDLEEEPSPADLSPELTKHFRGLRMWLPLQLFGLSKFRAALKEKIYLCRYFYEEIQKIGFEVGPYPDLSVMVYRYVPENGDANEFNKALVKMVREDGRVFLSSTTIKGQVWLRLAVLCFRSHLEIVNRAIEVLKQSKESLLIEHQSE